MNDKVFCLSCCAVKVAPERIVCGRCWAGFTEKRRNILLHLREDANIAADLVYEWLLVSAETDCLALRQAFARQNPAYPLWLLEEPMLLNAFDPRRSSRFTILTGPAAAPYASLPTHTKTTTSVI